MTCDQGNLGPSIEWLWDKTIGDNRKLIHVLCNANNMNNIQCLFIFHREKDNTGEQRKLILLHKILHDETLCNTTSY